MAVTPLTLATKGCCPNLRRDNWEVQCLQGSCMCKQQSACTLRLPVSEKADIDHRALLRKACSCPSTSMRPQQPGVWHEHWNSSMLRMSMGRNTRHFSCPVHAQMHKPQALQLDVKHGRAVAGHGSSCCTVPASNWHFWLHCFLCNSLTLIVWHASWDRSIHKVGHHAAATVLCALNCQRHFWWIQWFIHACIQTCVPLKTDAVSVALLHTIPVLQ